MNRRTFLKFFKFGMKLSKSKSIGQIGKRLKRKYIERVGCRVQLYNIVNIVALLTIIKIVKVNK